MYPHETCDIINTATAEGYRAMLAKNDSMMLLDLQDIYTNYTGDWGQLIVQSRAKLRANLFIKSPGSELFACHAYAAIWMFLPPVIVILGTVGNLLSFSVLCRRSMIQVSSYIYLAVLALVDEGVLITGLFRRWIDKLIGSRVEDLHPATCKLLQVAGVSTSCLSVWLIVALTAERVIVISFPLHAVRLATPRRAMVIIVGIVIACILVSLHFLETVDLVPIEGDGEEVLQTPVNSSTNSTASSPYHHVNRRCTFKTNYKGISEAWTWVDAALYSYLPFFIITILNIIIIRGVYRARQNRASLVSTGRLSSSTKQTRRRHQTASTRLAGGSASSGGSSANETTRQLTIMLLVVSVVFLVFTTPIVVVKFLVLTLDFQDSVFKRATFQLVDCIAEMLMYLNHALNFFLYCAMGNKFRQQLRILCCLGQARKRCSAKESCADTGALAEQKHHQHPHRRKQPKNEGMEMTCLVGATRENGAVSIADT